ncbi:hypothetical protein KIKIMORA_01550 [Brevundimonas phage vB_BpoS-Kikimora]|uniref:Uncharacterized protein n=1 Tax=Brevundimonas phage vB_BpoS-Kikimora TaxID=2948601 RepID=A0A9E7MR32_9CAUD|nr:hypothetical protein KIKIMORA_01550 [Brevundimonas phage vB_BpoS-Kikimora]
MEPIRYEQVKAPRLTSDVRQGFQPDGCRWWLADREHDVAYGSLTLGDPDRSRFKAYAESLKTPMEDRDLFSRDHRYLSAHVSPQSEIIYCSRMEMLIALIERLRDPTPAKGTVVDVLTAANFKVNLASECYALDIGKGSIWVWVQPEGLRAQFHGRGRMWWTNLLRVQTATKTRSGDLWETFWPEDYGDVEAKAAEFLIEHYIPWVQATRILRNTR